jgi:hypothetical protein
MASSPTSVTTKSGVDTGLQGRVVQHQLASAGWGWESAKDGWNVGGLGGQLQTSGSSCGEVPWPRGEVCRPSPTMTSLKLG